MKKIHTIFTSLLLSASLFAQANAINNPGKAPENLGRPSVALVLSGGGVNGAAHVPVLEMLEEYNIPVDIILGTSIGAIVGGLYSSGYTTDQIHNLFSTQNWPSIFADFSPSPYEFLYNQHGIKQNLLPLRAGTDAQFQIGKGVSNGQMAYEMIKNLVLNYPSNLDFDTLPIPFRAMATNMYSGEPYLFRDGDLAEAIRTSMNVAGLFEPFDIDGTVLLDGGLVNNLPVNIAKQMGYDIIIAVEISPASEKPNRQLSTTPLYALQDSIYIPMKNTDLLYAKDADLLICPNMTSFEITDFNKAEEIYNEGKIAAENARPEFQKIYERIYGQKKVQNVKEETYSKTKKLVPTKLQINNAWNEDLKLINKSFEHIQNKELTTESFNDFVNSIYKTGHYKHVRARFINTDDECICNLILNPKDKTSLMILSGINIQQTVFGQDMSSYFNFNTAIQIRDFTTADSLFSVRGTFLNNWAADVLYFQPFTKNTYTSFNTAFNHEIYKTGNDYRFWTNHLALGINYFANTLFEAGFLYDYSGISPQSSTNFIDQGFTAGYFTHLRVDFHDQPCFSSKAFYLDAYGKFINPLKDQTWNNDNSALLLYADSRFSFPITKRFSVTGNLAAGYDFLGNLTDQPYMAALHGFNNFDRIYFPQNGSKTEISDRKFGSALSLQYCLNDELTIAGGKLYVLANGTYGTLNNFDNVQWSASAGLGFRAVDSFNIFVRMGVAGINTSDVRPIITCDIGALRF